MGNFNWVQFRNIGLVLVFLFTWAGFFLQTGATFNVTLYSDTPGVAKVYYPAAGGLLFEENSVTQAVVVDRNKLAFPLRGDRDWLRFDPIDAKATGHIAEAHIGVPVFKVALPVTQFIEGEGLQTIPQPEGAAGLSYEATSADPVFQVVLPSKRILVARLAGTATLAAIFTLLVWQWREILATLRRAGCAVARLCTESEGARRILPAMVGALVLIWLYSLTNYSISIDQELAAWRTDQRIWADQGRWLTYFLTVYVLPQPVVPFLPTLILCASLLLSYLIILAAHNLGLNWKTLLLFALYAAFPFWYFIAEFYANLLSVGVGLILTCGGLLTFHVLDQNRAAGLSGQMVSPSFREKLGAFLCSAFMVGIATGAYQSFLPAFAALATGSVFWQLYQGRWNGARHFIWQLAIISAICIVAATVHVIANSVTKVLLAAPTAYVDQMNRIGLLFLQPGQVIGSTIDDAFNIYSGSQSIFGVPLWGIGAAMLIALLQLLRLAAQQRQIALPLLICALACLAAPVSMNLVAGGALSVPYRAMVAMPYVVWLFAAMALFAPVYSRAEKSQINGSWASNARGATVTVAAFAVSLGLLQAMSAHANYNALRALTLEHDKALASQLYARIVEVAPEHDRSKPLPVAFQGAKQYGGPFPRVHTSAIGGSFFEWDGGNPERIFPFMHLMGYQDLAPVSKRTNASFSPLFETMPMWPAAGSVRMHKGVVLVKLGP